ncbi:hypothetical protein CsatB_022681 [Cannabis sativa]
MKNIIEYLQFLFLSSKMVVTLFNENEDFRDIYAYSSDWCFGEVAILEDEEEEEEERRSL